MRRYRKGQTFRPPTTAESAASADAIEGHRRRSPLPQNRLSRGDKILVKTHADGIPARVGTTIYSAICTRLVETSTAEDKTLLETDEEIEVFNLETTNVTGGIYAQTGLTLHGTRCVEMGGSSGTEIISFRVLYLLPFGAEISSACSGVRAEILAVSCNSSFETGDEVDIYDPAGCWFSIPIGVLELSEGMAVYMARGPYFDIPDCVEMLYDPSCWWTVQTLCCTEEIYSS
jgi:hypothetical protein